MYTSMYYILTYFAGSFGRYNIHTKVFCWLMTVHPIVTALTGLKFTNLLPYILQVVPIITGYYNRGPGRIIKYIPDQNTYLVKSQGTKTPVVKKYHRTCLRPRKEEHSTRLVLASQQLQKHQAAAVDKAPPDVPENILRRGVKDLDVQAFWIPPTYSTSSHFLIWCPSNILFDIPGMVTKQYHLTIQVSSGLNPSCT
ncbi:hypothetical protein DSO57_1026670 [Entomophthora muscae]|uniref:Uncharacterized protein n=1 Tax=Entomophthora muscae TaxID=34485 RepID=A0ACC2RT00_9FUNG|nr:hypothetical protein DSO57_1026670 [Entomophthora muscae]